MEQFSISFKERSDSLLFATTIFDPELRGCAKVVFKESCVRRKPPNTILFDLRLNQEPDHTTVIDEISNLDRHIFTNLRFVLMTFFCPHCL